PIFAGPPGRRVSLHHALATRRSSDPVNKPDGTRLTGFGYCCGGAFLDVQTLPASGSYTILVDPSGTGTGSATLTLYDVPADVTGMVAPAAQAVSLTTPVPRHNACMTF